MQNCYFHLEIVMSRDAWKLSGNSVMAVLRRNWHGVRRLRGASTKKTCLVAESIGEEGLSTLSNHSKKNG